MVQIRFGLPSDSIFHFAISIFILSSGFEYEFQKLSLKLLVRIQFPAKAMKYHIISNIPAVFFPLSHTQHTVIIEYTPPYHFTIHISRLKRLYSLYYRTIFEHVVQGRNGVPSFFYALYVANFYTISIRQSYPDLSASLLISTVILNERKITLYYVNRQFFSIQINLQQYTYA